MTEQKAIVLSAALKQLELAVQATAIHFSSLDPNDIPTLLKSYKQLDENRDMLETLTKIIKQIHQECSYNTIPTAFENNGGIDSVKLAGRNFIVSVRLMANISIQSRETAHKWLIEEAKIPELIVPTVNSKSLSAFIKGYFEANAKMPPENSGISIHNQKYTQMRKV